MAGWDDYEEIEVIEAGKRLGLNRTPWMGDWFVSFSPRNYNSTAEGYWDHWVDLAIKILQHPATEIVRPEAHAAVKDVPVADFYSEVNRQLTDEEIAKLFGEN